MLYDEDKREQMLEAAKAKVSSVVDLCVALAQEGYIPNKNKFTKISWAGILIDAFDNIDVLSVEQHNKLENIYSKVLSL